MRIVKLGRIQEEEVSESSEVSEEKNLAASAGPARVSLGRWEVGYCEVGKKYRKRKLVKVAKVAKLMKRIWEDGNCEVGRNESVK